MKTFALQCPLHYLYWAHCLVYSSAYRYPHPPWLSLWFLFACSWYKLTLGSLTYDCSMFPGPQNSFSFNTAGSPWCGILPQPSEPWNPFPLLAHPTGRITVSPKPQLDFQIACPGGEGLTVLPPFSHTREPCGWSPGSNSFVSKHLLTVLSSLHDSRAVLLFLCWKHAFFLIPTLLSQWAHHTQAGSDASPYLKSPYPVVLIQE